MRYTLSTPSASNSASLFSSGIIFLGASPSNTSLGLCCNVKTAETIPLSSAYFTASFITALCPLCTPSKYPSAVEVCSEERTSSLIISIIIVLYVQFNAHLWSKRFLTVSDCFSMSVIPSPRNSPS